MAGGGATKGYGGYGDSSMLSDGGDPAPSTGLSGLEAFGQVWGVAGAINSAIGSYYAAQSQRYQLKSQALDLDYQRSMAALNARAAEQDAALELEAGKREAGRVGLQYRQVKAGQRTSVAAGGIQAGVGSAAEVAASIETSKELDMITINANAVRAANAARTRGVGFRAQARMAGVGAENARRMSSAISPWAAGASSLLGGAGYVAREWAASERYSARYRGAGSY